MAAQTTHSRPEAWPTYENDYIAFSDLPVLLDGEAVEHMATPGLAMAWADAIVAYWANGVRTAMIRCDQPLYLLDLNPACGQFVWLLFKALRRKTSGTAFQMCYLACSTRNETLRALSQHPNLQEAIEGGSFDTALIPTSYDSLHLRHQNHSLLRTDNPIVVIALGHFQTMPSELFGVHHGQLLEGRVAVERDQDGGKCSRLDYQWLDTAAPALAAPLLEKYLPRCSSASVLLPLTACAQLDAMSRVSAGRYLLLSADTGVCTEQAIRLGALRPPAEMYEGGIVVPFSTHALHLHQQQRGALTWHQQLRDDGCAVFVACNAGDSGLAENTQTNAFDQMTDRLSAAHPEDFCHDPMATIGPSDPTNAAIYLSAMRRSQYDPRLLKAVIEHLIDRTEMMETSLRRSWQEALLRTMDNYFPQATNDGLHYQAGLCAIGLGDFGAARHYLQRSMDWYGEDATELYLLAYCEAASGDAAFAREILQRALSLDPQHSHSLDFLSHIEERLDRWQKNRYYLPHAPQDGALRLEPLGAEHAPALLYQYRDDQIGIMTRLQELATLEQVQEWIVAQEQDEGRASFAVMHERWGLVGVVSMQCAGASGYFYFWIGSDFQDQGLGQQAAHLLFDTLAQQGITDIFTSAYDDNTRSIHALEKLGFGRLGMRAREPDETLTFFHLNQHANSSEDMLAINAALLDLCRAIDSSLKFVDLGS